jgi:hypothetical protein
MYNVMEKLRANEALSDKEKITHEQGLVSVLRQIHDDLDRAVFDAYGWPSTLSDEEILERVVSLNAERAREERMGVVRWLRPAFQNPQSATQTAIDTGEGRAAPASEPARRDKAAWPSTLPEQVKAVRGALAAQAGALTPDQLSDMFKGGKGRTQRVLELLQTLASLGQAREVQGGRFVAF